MSSALCRHIQQLIKYIYINIIHCLLLQPCYLCYYINILLNIN